MQPLFRLAQIVSGAPGHHFPAVVDKALQGFFEIENLGSAVDDGEHVDAEGVLESRVLVKLVDNDVGQRIPFQFYDDAHAVAVGFISDIGDPFYFFLVDQLGDLLDQPFLVHHVGDFADDDLFFARAFYRFDEGFAAHLNNAFALSIRLHDGLFAVNESGGRKIRAWDMFHQLPDGDIGIFNQLHQTIDDLAQIVRRNIGRHADGDPRGSVDKKVRDARRQDRRFFERVIVVGVEIDGFLINIGEHFLRQRGHANFGVAHRRGVIAIDGAEISLAVD